MFQQLHQINETDPTIFLSLKSENFFFSVNFKTPYFASRLFHFLCHSSDSWSSDSSKAQSNFVFALVIHRNLFVYCCYFLSNPFCVLLLLLLNVCAVTKKNKTWKHCCKIHIMHNAQILNYFAPKFKCFVFLAFLFTICFCVIFLRFKSQNERLVVKSMIFSFQPETIIKLNEWTFLFQLWRHMKKTETHKRHPYYFTRQTQNSKTKTQPQRILHQNHSHLFNMLYAYSFAFISSCLIHNITTNIHSVIHTY